MPRLTPDDLHFERVPIDSLRPHPQNPRQGDLELLGKSVRRHGVYRAIVVSEDDVVICGNHTYLAAKAEGADEVWVTRLPLQHDEPEASQILLTDNRLSDTAIAGYDEDLLASLLTDMPELPVGYTDEQVQELVDSLEVAPDPAPPEPSVRVCPNCGFVIE